MQIVVYTKTNNRYFLKAITLEHARERCKRILEEGLLLEDYHKEEFYPPALIYKVQIVFNKDEIAKRQIKYKGLFPNWE